MERLRVRIETPQTPRIRLNVRPVLTEEDKEVKHIIEESKGRLQAERPRRREQRRWAVDAEVTLPCASSKQLPGPLQVCECSQWPQ